MEAEGGEENKNRVCRERLLCADGHAGWMPPLLQRQLLCAAPDPHTGDHATLCL